MLRVWDYCALTLALLNPRAIPLQCYVRRQRLPRDWRFRESADDRDTDIDNDNDVKELDLYVGGSVNVWGRKIHLVGCDPFTKEYYQ